jgi:hypothetical protein
MCAVLLLLSYDLSSTCKHVGVIFPIALTMYPTSSSKVAIKMGRVSEKGKDKSDDRLASRNSEASDEEHNDEAGDREETPDLYRNSALGM